MMESNNLFLGGELELKKSDLKEIKIEKIVYGGEGLGYIDGFAIFVPMSVPGDKLLIEIISLKKSYGRGLIKKIIEAGEDRVKGERVTFEEFHGCDFAMLNYSAQLKYKMEMVKDVMTRIGKITDLEISPIVGSEDIYNYRNKVIEPFSLYDGSIITGFFRRKSHDVFEVEENFLNSKLGNKIIKELKEILNSLEKKISVYSEKNHKGVLRHIMVRTNSLGEAMVVLIVNAQKDNPIVKGILKKLCDKIPEIKSVYISINKEKTNFALGREIYHIYGEEIIKEEFFGIKFNISPLSFFQINKEQTKKLYETALDFSKGIEDKIVIDAYSGTGTIGMILSKRAKKVYAIEIVKSATEDGKKTAKENGIKNIEFINGAVEDKLVSLLKEGVKIDSIFLDPPRKGVEESALIHIADTKIKEIVYISCNPSTLARDAAVLAEHGYKVEKIQPVDMFPQTAHVECVALIRHRL